MTARLAFHGSTHSRDSTMPIRCDTTGPPRRFESCRGSRPALLPRVSDVTWEYVTPDGALDGRREPHQGDSDLRAARPDDGRDLRAARPDDGRDLRAARPDDGRDLRAARPDDGRDLRAARPDDGRETDHRYLCSAPSAARRQACTVHWSTQVARGAAAARRRHATRHARGHPLAAQTTGGHV